MSQSDTMFCHAVKAIPDGVISLSGPRLPDDASCALDRPYALIGRSEKADAVLPDRTVSLRHAFVQQINGRLFVVDLFSANGTRISGRKIQAGWWPENKTVAVGPFDLKHAVAAPDDELPPSPMEFRPRSDTHPFYERMPEVSLELLDSKSQRGHAWPINRVLTFLGRDSRCRITCSNDSVSLVHCVFVLTPAGLWVVDLLSRNGVQVNGKAVDCALLSDGFEVRIGQYKMRSCVTPQSSAEQPVFTNDQVDIGFLTRTNKVFHVDVVGSTVVITPQGDLPNFLYQDFQTETNVVMRAVTHGGCRHVVVNFSKVPICGTIVIEAIAGFCRAASGKAATCCATANVYGVLDTMKLNTVWYHYASQEDAIAAVTFDDPK